VRLRGAGRDGCGQNQEGDSQHGAGTGGTLHDRSSVEIASHYASRAVDTFADDGTVADL
jgi:hypothetical protein